MDITLINIVFPTLLGTDRYFYVPVGVLSLSAYLEREGFSTEVMDYQLNSHPEPNRPEAFCEFFQKARSPVVGISVMAKDMPGALIACRLLKEKSPDTVIILGGPGPTGTAAKLMETFSFVDFVVRGEGEETLCELMKALKDGGDCGEIRGLTWRKPGSGGEVVNNPPRDRIENLDDLPFPAYDKLDVSRYNQIYLPSARGCRHFCAFCDQPALWRGKEVRRSLDNLFREIDFITVKLKAPWEIAFSDNEFCSDDRRFEEFQERYQKGGYGFVFSVDRRIDSIDEEFLSSARLINCLTVLYGVESGSDRVLKEIRKGFKSSHIKPGLLLSAKHMENSIASFMFNYPFETITDFMATINVIYSAWLVATPHFITFQLHYLAPLPRTPILEKYRHLLIRRNVSNLMTARRNETQYEQVIDGDKKKAAVLPISLEEEEEVEPMDAGILELVEKYPDIFPSYYIYDSPQRSLKEHVIRCLQVILGLKWDNVLFRYEDYFIHFNRGEARAASTETDAPGDSLFFRLKPGDFDNPGELAGKMESFGEKKLLISVDMKGAKGDRTLGIRILEALSKMREKKLSLVFLSHVSRDFCGFLTNLKLTSQFGMPENPIDAADSFYVDEEGYIRGFNHTRHGLIFDYKNREDAGAVSISYPRPSNKKI